MLHKTNMLKIIKFVFNISRATNQTNINTIFKFKHTETYILLYYYILYIIL